MQFHVKRLRAFYLHWIRAVYKFRYNNNKNRATLLCILYFKMMGLRKPITSYRHATIHNITTIGLRYIVISVVTGAAQVKGHKLSNGAPLSPTSNTQAEVGISFCAAIW